MIRQTYQRINKSALTCVYLRFVLNYILLPLFSMKPVPASDSARFLTQLNDIFFKINYRRRYENQYSNNYCFSQFSRFCLNRTRMTQIRRIFTDPCASVSSAQSVFYRRIPHPILYTKVNKTDNFGALKYKEEILVPIYEQPSITRKTPPKAAPHRGTGSQPRRRPDADKK